jgi:LysM repeat protein
MTRQQTIFIIALNAIISLAISLLVTWLMAPRAAPTERLPPGVRLTATAMESTSPSQASAPGQPAPLGTPTPIVHVVRTGDSLSWIAEKYNVPMERIMEENSLSNPDKLVVGQELIIPPLEAEPTVTAEAASPTPTKPAPSSTATPTATPTGTEEEFDLKITHIVAPGRQEAEVLVLTNRGPNVRLQGWTLSNGQGQEYTFPNLTLFRGNSVRIYTTEGRNSPSDLYWGLDSAAWGPEVEFATLKDPQENVQATYELP